MFTFLTKQKENLLKYVTDMETKLRTSITETPHEQETEGLLDGGEEEEEDEEGRKEREEMHLLVKMALV